MELRPLLDVDLREVLAPINRAARGEFVPALRTVAQLRERAACGVLDLRLSRACYIGGALGAACLVEHVPGESVAHIEALACEPLAQQRGATRALIEGVQAAAAAAGVTELCMLASELDSALGSALELAGFERRQGVERYLLSGPPAALALPTEVATPGEVGSEPGDYASPLAIDEALAAIPDPRSSLYAGRPAVLRRLAARLSALGLWTVASVGAPKVLAAALVFDRERKSLCALGGDGFKLAALLAVGASRHGAVYLDAIAESHPAVSALRTAGFVRSAARVERVCDPKKAVAARERAAAVPTTPKGGE